MTSKENDKVTFSDRAFAGSLAGFSTRFFSQPLDVLKIRFQVSYFSLSLQAVLSSGQMDSPICFLEHPFRTKKGKFHL